MTARRLVAFLVAAACGVAACTGADDDLGPMQADPTVAEAPELRPPDDRPGVLRVAAAGGVDHGLDPLADNGVADLVAVVHLYDSLVRVGDDGIELSLAESIEPDADATEWTIRIREDATFHDGSPVTAGDVSASILRLADPEQNPVSAVFLADIDLLGVRTTDTYTTVVPMLRPRADFVEAMLSIVSYVFPAGHTDWSQPNGSGPYRLESYEPGVSTVLVAVEDHWAGTPTVERIEVVTVADPVARFEAVRTRGVDVAVNIDPVTARGADPATVAVRRGGPSTWRAMSLMIDPSAPPFDDPTVRAAVAQVLDRQALVDTVLLGFGAVGNDLVGAGLPTEALTVEPVEHDVDAAAAAFAAAGVDRVEMVVADVTPGIVAAAEVMVGQFAEAGVELVLDRRDAATYFDDFDEFLARPMQGMFWANRPAAAFLANFTGTGGFFAPGGADASAYDEALATAQSTVDPVERQVAFERVQRLLHDSATNIVWGYQEQLDAVAPDVLGVATVQSVPFLAAATIG